MKAITASTVQSILRELADNEPGEWVLLGGSLVLACEASNRATFDIDLGRADTAELFTPFGLVALAEKHGLPIEAINQSVNYYLHKTDFRPFLIPWIKGQKSTIFRPHFALFLELKLARLSVSDAEDLIAYAKKFPDEVTLTPNRVEKIRATHGHKQGWSQLATFLDSLSDSI